jgi:hypothetical protein
VEILATKDNFTSEITMKEREPRSLKETKEIIKRMPNQHMGSGKRDQRDRAKQLLGKK